MTLYKKPMSSYDFQTIETKWQAEWAAKQIYKTTIDHSKPKFYALDMFPYPSGAGLHVGHPLGYIASDIVSRYKRLNGFNVLHPMGFDAFGLPAEQYAIQTGQHPAITTEENLKRYKEQLNRIGFCYDWDREIRTTDPKYYKWTQWIFIQLFESWYNAKTDKAESIDTLITIFENEGNVKVEHNGEEVQSFTAEDWENKSKQEKEAVLQCYRLAFQKENTVNWCEELGTVLANDEVKNGLSERGGYPVTQKVMKQWYLRITAYADRLLDGLNTIDWSDSIKETQRNWIGKSQGASIDFRVASQNTKQESVERQKWQTSNPELWQYFKSFGRENRKNQTEAENIIWQEVRNRKLEHKFRRQHAINDFIVDFVCLDKKLVIEIDGGYHNVKEQEKYDEYRTFVLNQEGFKVIRFTNEEVIKNTDQVLLKIKRNADERISPQPLAPSPQENGNSPLRKRGAGGEAIIEVFTTRPDTIFGSTFMVLAPDHELVSQITTDEQRSEIEAYATVANNKSELERKKDKSVSGVFTGAYALHPFTQKKLPIFISEYVLSGYGTGAIMAVPAHDERDHAFAKKFGLDIIQVIESKEELDIQEQSYDAKHGKLMNSENFDRLSVKEAMSAIIQLAEERGFGTRKINYKLRDAGFSRQRYWGEPFPIVHADGIPTVINELPVELPEVDSYVAKGTTESPLSNNQDWVNYNAGGVNGKRETDTMPGYAGSSWYFLRYMDPNNETEFAGKESLEYWNQVDLYIGGTEHATGHLLYSRFWTKFLCDRGYISFDEPFKKLVNQGMILGESKFIYQVAAELSDPNSLKAFPSQGRWLPIFVTANEMEAQDSKIKDKLISFINDYKDFNLSFKTDQISTRKIRVPSIMVEGDKVLLANLKLLWEKHKVKELLPPVFLSENNDVFLATTEIEKMSKSKVNVVNPDDIADQYGADTLRLYEMFLGPLEDSKPWSTKGIDGTYRFLKKLWALHYDQDGNTLWTDTEASKDSMKTLHATIKKITEDISTMSLNTSVAQFMICVNELGSQKCTSKSVLEQVLILLNPFAPHITEELWNAMGNEGFIADATWPEFDEKHLVESSKVYPISINGKTRTNLEFPLDMSKDEIEKNVLADEIVQKWLDGNPPKKVIVVPGRIVNVVM